MAKKAHKQQASALDEVRRHVRIFVDLGRVAIVFCAAKNPATCRSSSRQNTSS
jgi:hypothetical protein